MNIAFIIGSPRSGTTILGDILDRHMNIAQWYESYYMWAYFIDSKESDVWKKEMLTKKALAGIRREYSIYQRKSGKSCIIDKTPEHAFHIEVILEIFPTAKWIHIIRDGRDVTLSIKKEWNKRSQMVNEKNYRQLLMTSWRMLRRQPYIRYILMALCHEILNNRSLNPKMYLNKSKWKGKPYWGPRFAGWETYLANHEPIEFNAMQWVKSVEAVFDSWHLIQDRNKLEIRYEDLLQDPERMLAAIVKFLGFEADSTFLATIPKLYRKNFNKWKTGFTASEINKIKPILNPLLEKLEYTKRFPW